MGAGVIRSRQIKSSIDTTSTITATTTTTTAAVVRRRPLIGTITATSTNRHRYCHRHRWIFVTMATWMVASMAGRTVLSFSFRSNGGRTMSMIQQHHFPKATTTTAAFSSSSSSFQGARPPRFRIVAAGRKNVNPCKNRAAYGSSALTMMPEGPEVRTLVDQLKGGIGKRLVDVRFLSGRYLGQRPVGFMDFAKTMTPISSQEQQKQKDDSSSNNNNINDKAGTTIDTILDWNCKGKFIYILMDDGIRALASQNSSDTNTSNVNDNKDDADDDDDFQRSIWITLGMTGRFVNEARHMEDPSHGRWVLELFDEYEKTNTNTNINTTDDVSDKPETLLHKIYYHDKRNFGTVKFCLSKAELDQKLNSLGPDVLALARQLARQTEIIPKVDVDDNFNIIENEFNDPSITIDDELEARKTEASATTAFLELLEKQRNKRLNVCKFLMDQKKIAGVGNYILSEALYRSDIDPFCGIDELSTSQRIRLFREIQAVCIESYRSQHESSNSTKGVTTGYTSVRLLAPFSFELRVYGKIQGICPKGNPILRETKGPHGRTIWYTEQQLFVARNIREQRERKLQEQLQQQKQEKQQQQQQQNTPTASASEETKNNPWTITRRDGVDLTGASNNNGGGGGDDSAIKEKEAIDETWNVLDGLTEPGWKTALEPYAASSDSFATLQDFLQQEYSNYGQDQIYPPPHQIFSALNLCPLDKVKIVILGQDPYHGPNQSTGLAFSVSKQISKIPPSLRNIFKELDDDFSSSSSNSESENPPPPVIRHGDLEGWAKQGVLMLNTVLTVRRGQANSHQKKGWEDFTDEIVSILKDRANNDNGMVFLLWGGPASKKAKSISESETDHVVIATSHPSPLGATKTASPFLTSRCFSRANTALVELGQDPIDWYDR